MSRTMERKDLWLDDGHLSEAALAAIGDGQDVVGEEASAHAESCAECATRLVAVASLATEVQSALAPIAAERARAARRFPSGLVLAALVLAGLGLAPSLADRSLHALSIATSLPELLPRLASTAGAIAGALSQGPLGASIAFSVFAVLALSGAIIARSARSQRGVSS